MNHVIQQHAYVRKMNDLKPFDKQNEPKMKFKLISAIVIGVVILSSCENPMTFETKVYEDGTFDKTIIFEKNDSSIIHQNMFGINEDHGWSTIVTKLQKETKEKSEQKNWIAFSKHFSSIDEMNSELNTSSDSLFHIKSTFKKKFRWFYTYIEYTETFAPINRFKMLSISDYLTKEDYQFINRLPHEGSSISKADSLFLQMLNVKIMDEYVNMAIFNEEYDILTKVMQRSRMDKKWYDTLAKKRELMFSIIDDIKGDGDLAMEMADTLQIPLPRDQAMKDTKELSRDLNSRMSFMSFAKDGKYKNSIDMPWQVIETNADSVSGNKLFWRPASVKFLVTDYVMYSRSRKPNLWAVLISGAFILITLFVILRKRMTS